MPLLSRTCSTVYWRQHVWVILPLVQLSHFAPPNGGAKWLSWRGKVTQPKEGHFGKGAKWLEIGTENPQTLLLLFPRYRLWGISRLSSLRTEPWGMWDVSGLGYDENCSSPGACKAQRRLTGLRALPLGWGGVKLPMGMSSSVCKPRKVSHLLNCFIFCHYFVLPSWPYRGLRNEAGILFPKNFRRIIMMLKDILNITSLNILLQENCHTHIITSTNTTNLLTVTLSILKLFPVPFSLHDNSIVDPENVVLNMSIHIIMPVDLSQLKPAKIRYRYN